jgi:FKBP-type peptidyl-prolyl cis-trans isomerase 2
MVRMRFLFQIVILFVVCLSVPAFGSMEHAAPAETAQTQDGGMVVQPGDSIDLLYHCRGKTGEVVAASAPVKETDPKSNIFMTRKETGPLSVLAVRSDEPLPEKLWPGPFEEEILERLTREVNGMKEGDTRQVALTAQMILPKDEQSGFARLSRVRTRPKKMTMPKGDYEFRARKSPEIGQDYAYDPAFPGKVEAITDKDVIIRFSAKPGDIIQTPFGPGLIREEGEDYKVDINAKDGSLVRTGNKIGRITRVDEKEITVDYRHPFGYEALTCDITVGNIIKANPVEIGAGKQ